MYLARKIYKTGKTNKNIISRRKITNDFFFIRNILRILISNVYSPNVLTIFLAYDLLYICGKLVLNIFTVLKQKTSINVKSANCNLKFCFIL